VTFSVHNDAVVIVAAVANVDVVMSVVDVVFLLFKFDSVLLL
jgi:hypothetical protein